MGATLVPMSIVARSPSVARHARSMGRAFSTLTARGDVRPSSVPPGSTDGASGVARTRLFPRGARQGIVGRGARMSERLLRKIRRSRLRKISEGRLCAAWTTASVGRGAACPSLSTPLVDFHAGYGRSAPAVPVEQTRPLVRGLWMFDSFHTRVEMGKHHGLSVGPSGSIGAAHRVGLCSRRSRTKHKGEPARSGARSRSHPGVGR
jgi:hypothetical protein